MKRLASQFLEAVKGFPKTALYTIALFALLGIVAPWVAPHDPLTQAVASV